MPDTKHVSPNGYSDDYGPNVSQILCHGTRVVGRSMPQQVRRELSAAVKAGVLGHLPKDGNKPEIFYHPNHKNGAIERQKLEAEYVAKVVANVICTPAQVRDGIEAMGGNVLEQVLSERVAKATA